jgi:hypothetical protein
MRVNKSIKIFRAHSDGNFFYSSEEDKGNVLLKKVYDKKLGKEKLDGICLKECVDENKDVIQSYIITAAKYNFSVYEVRILLRIVECFQYMIKGEKLDNNFSIDKSLYGSVIITLPVSSLLLKEKDENYIQIRKALLSLLDKKIEFNNGVMWKAFTLIEEPEIVKYNRTVSFRLPIMVYEALLDFSKGYRKYELETAMSFRSVYAMRFYELFSGQKKSLTYSIAHLKEMFFLKDKYKDVNLFVSRVIVSAKKELDLKAPYSFTYRLEYEGNRKQKGRKRVVGITFTPLHRLNKKDKYLSDKNDCMNIVLSDILISKEKEVLISFGFKENELKTKYFNLFYDIYLAKKRGKTIISPAIIDYSRKAKNSKIYIIRALKKEVKFWKEFLLYSEFFYTNKKCINYSQEQLSVYSFLKNYLCFSKEELNKVMLYVMDKGVGEYFNKIICYSDEDNKKIKDRIISDMALDQLVYNLFSISKMNNLNFHYENNSCQVSIYKPVMNFAIKSSNQFKLKKSAFSMCKLRENWCEMVLKRITFKEKIGYYVRFCSKNYLKEKADKLGLSIYI